MLEASLENTTQTMTCPSAIWRDLRAIINAALAIAGLRCLFALWTSHVSSSWLNQIPSFKQETCQANYRNEPVKYDLAVYRYVGS
jgi:hypothetical protein